MTLGWVIRAVVYQLYFIPVWNRWHCVTKQRNYKLISVTKWWKELNIDGYTWLHSTQTKRVYHCCFFKVTLQCFEWVFMYRIDGFVQDCSNSVANALELLQSCAKPLILASAWQVSEVCTAWWNLLVPCILVFAKMIYQCFENSLAPRSYIRCKWPQSFLAVYNAN